MQVADLPSWSSKVCLSQWKGLTNENSRVWTIDLYHMGCTGTPDLTKSPSTSRVLKLDCNKLSGTPNLSELPPTLMTLCLSCNKLSGTPDLYQLPPTLRELSLSCYQFSGCLTLPHLPRTLCELYLNDNSFKTLSISPNASRESFPENLTLRSNPWNRPLHVHPCWIADEM
jgi:hypothetical protein